jgi:ribosomal protein L23
MGEKKTQKGKPQVKKGVKSAPKSKDKQASQKNELQDELKKLIKDLDEEGLVFMIQQAHVLLHNMQVERVNEEIRKLQAKKHVGGKGASSDKYTIDVKEADDDSHFIIVINNSRNFFDRGEMKKLVKICHASGDEKDASRRLYNWFSGNRIDVLNNTDIRGASDPALSTIYNFLIKRYTVKED